MKKKKKIKLLLLVLVFIGIVSLIIIFKDNIKNVFIPIYRVEDRTKEVEKFSKKYTKEDVQGWIKVQGTNIDYPIINNYQDMDEEYSRSFDYAWTNGIVSKDDNYIPIFGHNIRNVSNKPIISDESMIRFEQLMAFIYYDFAKDNKYIQLTYKGENYLYRIYSFRLYRSVNSLNQPIKLDTKEKKDYIKDAINNSYFGYKTKVDESDKLISLITCTRFYGNSLYSFKIDAKLVKNKKVGYNYITKKKRKYEGIEKVLEGDENNA